MMKILLLIALIVTVLFFYINTNSEIDTIEGELNNSTKLETKDVWSSPNSVDTCYLET
jgi:hypothetical protein